MKTRLLRHIVVEDVALTNYRPGIYRNIERSSDVLFLDIAPVKSRQPSLHNGKFLNTSLILHIFIIESIKFVRLILNDELTACELGIESKKFTVL